MPILLLVLFGVALVIGTGLIINLLRHASGIAPRTAEADKESAACPFEPTCLFRRPNCWLTIKTRNVLAVKSALSLHNAKPCSWSDGLVGQQRLFISPPVKGWVVVTGSDLPDPSDDVDACFRFLVHLSHRLGHVQFFCANRILNHHAWVKAEGGRIVRGYAWAGTTVWHQGNPTLAEKDLALRSFGYEEIPDRPSYSQPDAATVNTDKVPLLAARWSIDPGRLDQTSMQALQGIAGEPSRRY